MTEYEKEKKQARRWAVKNGITDGTRPTDHPTREELWVMLYRANKRDAFKEINPNYFS